MLIELKKITLSFKEPKYSLVKSFRCNFEKKRTKSALFFKYCYYTIFENNN